MLALALAGAGTAALALPVLLLVDLGYRDPGIRAFRADHGPPGDPGSLPPERLRVLSLNVKHDYPDFFANAERAEAIGMLIRRADVDVVVLQEAWHTTAHGDLTQQLAQALGLHAAWARANGSLPGLGFEEGVGVLSRYPIAGSKRIELEPRRHVFARRIGLEVDIDVADGEPVAVVGTHLTNSDEQLAEAQAASLLDALEDRDPLLIAGDFNAASESATLRQFSERGFRHLVSGGIDHVLVSLQEEWHALYGEPLDTLARRESPSGGAQPISDHPALLVELRSATPPRASSWRGDWTEVPPSHAGFEEISFGNAADEILELDGVQGLLVARNGRLAFEGYRRGGARDRLHNLKSASKSVLSAIAGLAVAQGHLNLQQPIDEILGIELNGGRENITVEHLLTMRAGLESTSFRNYGPWVASRNWVRSALARDLVYPPGERFRYSTGATHLLSAVIAASTGRSTLDFAREHLFEPIGIRRVQWARDPQGIHFGGNNLSLTPRDMLRFGQLFLDRGRWGDVQVMPWEWVDHSTRADPRLEQPRWGGYGYLWWLRPKNERGAYRASGFGGQYIYVAPADDTVLVVTSTEISKSREWRIEIISLIDEILESSRGTAPRVDGHLPSG